MEKQLFTWQSWDIVDVGHFNFYEIVTKVQIGEIPVNSIFEFATVDYTKGILEFFDEDAQTVLHRFYLQLVILDR